MGSLGRLWAGRLSGGIAGRLHADLAFTDSGVTGRIGLHDEVRGVVVLDCEGRFDGVRLRLAGSPPPGGPAPGDPGRIRFDGRLEPEGELRGSWTADSGAAGAFVLFPDG